MVLLFYLVVNVGFVSSGIMCWTGASSVGKGLHYFYHFGDKHS